MEFINHRYKVMKQLKQDKFVSTYLVSDIQKDYQQMQLHIIKAEYIPATLIDYFIKDFIRIKNIDNKQMMRNYGFNSVSYIDNKFQAEKLYFYTSENIEVKKDLFEYIKQMNVDEIMAVFIEICQAIHYLHLKGFIYRNLCPNAITLTENDDLKLIDLATVELKNYLPFNELTSDLYKSASSLTGANSDIQSDLYSLCAMLLAMLNKQPLTEKPIETLLKLKLQKHRSIEEEKTIHRLIPIIEKVVTSNDSTTYETVYDFVAAINVKLNKNYTIIDKNELGTLHFHTELIGRDDDIKKVMKNYRHMKRHQSSTNIFIIEGDTGTGKTRFLDELKFLFQLKKSNVYTSFQLGKMINSNRQMWLHIVRKLISESDIHIVEKYESDLMECFPELFHYDTPAETQYEGHNKYRYVYKMGKFISECIHDKPAVILLDNIHEANEFTIDVLHYLCTELSYKNNMMFIFSYKQKCHETDSITANFIHRLKERDDVATITMHPLTFHESGKVIQNILSLPFTPVKVTNSIYSQSYGNPLFINEIIKDLYSRNILYIHDKTGKWYIDVPDEKSYQLLDVPTSIEQALMNQIKDIEESELELLKTVSIFSKPIPLHIIGQFVHMSEEQLEQKLQNLLRKEIIQSMLFKQKNVYDFSNKTLKNIVYNRMGADEKIQQHDKAATILEAEMNLSTHRHYDELIYHFERANNHEKSKTYYFKNAAKMRKQRNPHAEITNLEKALPLMKNDKERIQLLIKIGTLSLKLVIHLLHWNIIMKRRNALNL